jgi:potassium-transporting ATPase KdpC subunit
MAAQYVSSGLSQVRAAAVLLALFTGLTGLAYPAVVTGVAQLLFPHQANGSLIREGDKVVGSELIGQSFDDGRFFWGRPSATAPAPYNGAASTGSNLGPTNPALIDTVKARVAALQASDPMHRQTVPVDLVTASGSGLDPHITPAAAVWQIPRVAAATGLDPARVRSLVDACIESRTLGLFGEPRVNVLRLNRMLASSVGDTALR